MKEIQEFSFSVLEQYQRDLHFRNHVRQVFKELQQKTGIKPKEVFDWLNTKTRPTFNSTVPFYKHFFIKKMPIYTDLYPCIVSKLKGKYKFDYGQPLSGEYVTRDLYELRVLSYNEFGPVALVYAMQFNAEDTVLIMKEILFPNYYGFTL